MIALGDSFQIARRMTACATDRETLAALQSRRTGSGFRQSRSGAAATIWRHGRERSCDRAIVFRHEPTGAVGEIAGHLHPKARVLTRGRSVERRCFASDGERAVMPSFGAYTGGLSIRDLAFAAIFSAEFTAHVLGDNRMHAIAAARCY